MDRGYVKLWRKSLESEAFSCPHLWRLWCWCLIKANHKPRTISFKTGKGSVIVKVAAGEFIFGRNSAAESLMESPSTIWDRIRKLEKMKILRIRSNSQYSILTICNWKRYQDEHSKIQQATDTQPTPNRHPADTNKNDNNDKNDKKAIVDYQSSPSCPHQKIIDLYNSTLPSLTSVKPNLWNGQRAKDLQARWKEDLERQNLLWWENLFSSIREMPFLMGENERGWKADLGWIVKRKNWAKVLEGGFVDKKKAGGKSEWI